MAALQPFSPSYTRGIVVSPTLTAASSSITNNSLNVCFTNLGANVCYVRIGKNGITATTADFPILPSQQVALTKAFDDDTVSYISASGTSLHIITGEGWHN